MNGSISSLLPLLNESINSHAMVQHCTEVISQITTKLNPGQKVIIIADQPVYALGKQVQRAYNEKYDNVLFMLGPLHIEMAFLNVIGDWVEGSGWHFRKPNLQHLVELKVF